MIKKKFKEEQNKNKKMNMVKNDLKSKVIICAHTGTPKTSDVEIKPESYHQTDSYRNNPCFTLH